MNFILPIFAMTFLGAGWVVVQLIARRMHTKNLLDHRPTPCGGCEDEGACLRECDKNKTTGTI